MPGDFVGDFFYSFFPLKLVGVLSFETKLGVSSRFLLGDCCGCFFYGGDLNISFISDDFGDVLLGDNLFITQMAKFLIGEGFGRGLLVFCYSSLYEEFICN